MCVCVFDTERERDSWMCAHDELAASAAGARGARGVPAVWSRAGKLHLIDVTLGFSVSAGV